MRKKLCNRVMSVCLFLMVLFETFSVSAGERFLESYQTKEAQIDVYCADFEDGASVTADQFTVTLGSQEIPVLEVRTAEQADIPITYYCMVDVSGSMKEEQMDQAKAVLKSICDGMGINDNMVIGSLGNNLSTSDFLSDKDTIYAVINRLQTKDEDTNLYQGIVESMKVLKENSRVSQRRCLLLISDGEDDQKSGITLNEAEQAVKNYTVPVFTVAALRNIQTDAQVESAKLLGSFARMSVGGSHYAPMIDGMDAAAVGEDILQKIKKGIVLTLDTSGISTEKDMLLLRVVYTAAGQNVREDTMEIYAEDLQFTQMMDTENNVSEDAIETEDTENMVTPEKETDDRWMMIAGIAATVILLLVVIMIVLIRKRKKKAKETEEQERDREPEEIVVFEEESMADRQAEKRRRMSDMESGRLKSYCEVRFIAIGYEHINFTLKMEQGRIVTLGRDKRADFILNPKDQKLSGVHCKVQCVNNGLNIWDDNSTNGTFVNGVPIRQIGMVTVGDGQSVRMGSYEYRILISKEGETAK